MQNQKQIQKKIQAVTSVANSEFSESHISPAMLTHALKLIDSDVVAIVAVSPEGVLSGEVLDRKTAGTFECSVHLLPYGTFRVPFCSCGKGQTTQEGILCEHVLALTLHFAHLLGSKKLKPGLKKLLVAAPEWLRERYQLNVNLGNNVQDEIIRGIKLKNLKDLQAYWMLLEMASEGKQKIPAEVLVQHVLSIYESAAWGVKRAAMEAVLRRIGSVKLEDLHIASHLGRPANGQVFGFYRVHSRLRAAKRPYDVLLASPVGIDGSCSCPDFRKNTLGFCKHLASVMIHWNSSESLRARFTKSRPQFTTRLRWLPNTGLAGMADPLAGLQLSGDLGVAGLAGTAAKNLSRFFHGPGKSKPSQYGGFIFLGILPQSSQQSVQRLALLQDFSQALKSAQKLQKLLVDSAIPGMLEHEIHLLEWRADYPNHKKPLLKTFREMKVDLYPYQKEGVERALSEGRFLLGDDMGLGKTIQAITWAESLLKTGLAKTVVIICPAALKSQWRREWQQSSGRDVKIVEGSPSDRKMIYQNPPPVLILNYELLLRDLENILALAPDAVVLDEAQRIKNYASETARRVKRLNPRFRLVLTGTPMENRIEELSSLMDWVADGAMGPSWRLGAELSFADGVGHARAGVRGLGVLRKRLEPHMLRRLRSEVLPQLPKRTDTPIFLPLTDEQRDLHDEYGRKVALLARVAQQRPLTPAEHLRLMNLLAKMRIVSNALVQHDYEAAWPSIKAEKNPEAKLPYLSSPKLGEFRNLIEGLLSQKGVKIIIFSQWQRMLHLCSWAVSDLLRKEAVEAVFFTGAESTKQRTENIVRFHDDPSVRLFFATDAGGVGLNLQRAATVCINLELPWNPAVLEQRIGRIYRLGQESPVQIYHLITQGSIEERITALVGNKRAVFNALFDGHSDEVVFENGGGFYSQVQNVMHEMKLTPDVLDAPDDSDAENSDAETSDSEVSEEPVLAAPPAPAVTEAVVESVMADVLNSGEQALPSLSSGLSSETLAKAFSELKIAKSTDGVLSIEARGESAKLLAGLFRGMADLFDK